MKNHSKEVVLKVYNRLSVFLGLGSFILLFVYFNSFPKTMNGTVAKSILNFDFTLSIQDSIKIFNSPLIWFILFFIMNLGVLIYTQTGQNKSEGRIVESMFYNTIISFLLIVSQVVLYYLVPETVNGAIEFGLFRYEFVELSNKSVIGINFAYIFAMIYTIYNGIIIYLEIRENKPEF